MTYPFARKAHTIRVTALFFATLTSLFTQLSPAQATNTGEAKNLSFAPAFSGDINFLPAATFDSGGVYAYSVAVADVNGDGKPDLLMASCGPSGCGASVHGVVGVLLSNGDGTFKPVVTYDAGGGGTAFITVADVNKDGKLDLVVAANSYYSNTIGVLLGNGDGTFQPVVTFASGGGYPGTIVVTDVNGDGVPDIVVANSSGCYGCSDGGRVAVLLGNGIGSFQPPAVYSSGGYNNFNGVSLAVADLDGDGKLDIAVTNACGNSTDCSEDGTVGILLGNGNGTFQPATTYGTGGRIAGSLAVGDVNGDKKPDLLVANSNSTYTGNSGLGTVGVLLGNGNGTFQPAALLDSGGYGVNAVVVSDLNGDGKLDVVTSNACSYSAGGVCLPGQPGIVGVLQGNGDGTFQPAVNFGSGGYWFSDFVAVADVNGDGQPDIMIVNLEQTQGGRGSVGVLLNNTRASQTTQTALGSSVNPSVFGQPVTFTATVSAASGTPTGSVIFYKGAFTVLGTATLASGSAAISVSSLPLGSQAITAEYQGAASFAPSRSSPTNEVVTTATTKTALTSSPRPVSINQNVKYTATVTGQYGGVATGTITFADGGATIATVSLTHDKASYSTSYASAGTHSITATYSGDANYAGSTSSVLLEQIGSSQTALTTSGSPSLAGTPVTFTATVTSTGGAIPNGEVVTFYDGVTMIGTGSTSNGVATFTTSSLTAKTHLIKAIYIGDATFMPSSATVTQVVNRYATTTAFTSSLNPSIYGQPLTYTATVTSAGPGVPTGNVKITNIGLVPLVNGVAMVTRNQVRAGTHAITAEYLGDGFFSPSTSPVLQQVVKPVPTTTVLASSLNPSSAGQAVTFTASVTSSTGLNPYGTVTFTAGGATLGTVPLNNTIARVTTATLPAGSTIVKATYSGATSFIFSSASLKQVVHP